MVKIRETNESDIKNIQALWADGDVMKFVGFPDGLHQTDAQMEEWYVWISSSRPNVNHYSIFDGDTYCGESFYRIDPKHCNHASMDIKLFPAARGKGIAFQGLSHAITEAFKNGANAVWVDPDPHNVKAIALYKRLGFIEKPIPEYLNDDEYDQIYFEISKNEINK